MRVALLSLGGFIDYSIQLANALSDKQIKVLLIMPDFRICEYIDSLNSSVDVYIYSQPKLYYPQNITLLYKIISKVLIFKPDIIHIQGGHLWFSIVLPLLYLMKPIVTTQHDVEPHKGEDYIRTRFINYCARRFSHKLLVHGIKLRDILVTKYNIDTESIRVIPIGEHNVAPFLKYKQDGLKEEDNLVLFFGRICEYKGLKYLIESEPLIASELPDTKIVIAGQGGDFEKYEKLMRGKNNFIVYNRYISHEEGAKLFQRSCIVVLPYIDASQSGVVSTAYGFMKPVVATDVGSIPEIVDNGITGLIIPSKNSSALAKAIIELLRDKNARKRMGENAYKKLKIDMSWDKIAETTIQVYHEALECR